MLFIVGCTSSQNPASPSRSMITPTATRLLETATTESAASRELDLQTGTNFTATVTGTVRHVVPPDNMIIINRETGEGGQAIAVEADSILVNKEGSPLTLREIDRDMLIQATGRPREEDFLVAQRVMVLETPAPDPAGTATARASPAPPTPITLSDVSSRWRPHEFPERGIRLSMPADWKAMRMPGAYFFEPVTITSNVYKTQLTVSGKLNVPSTLPEMGEALKEEWQRLTPHAFYTTPVTVDGREGLAFWNISAAICTRVYVPAHDFVHSITFYTTFCNETGDGLNEVGQKILASIAFFPPTE